ncbi:MAG: recombinase family protein, partial [Solirubrobacteraceae bacterium]
MDAIGIIRVSRTKGRDGDSFATPETQRERIEAECDKQGLRLLRIESELDVSGGKPLEQRPGLKRAVEAVEAGDAQVIVSAYFDRLYRSLETLSEVTRRVEAAQGRVLTVDAGYLGEETCSEWLDLHMRGMMAAYYRRQIKERSRDAQRRAVERGVFIGIKAPPGYYRGEDGRLLVNEQEASLVAEAFRMRANGATIAAVRDWLKANGISRTEGGIWKLLYSKVVVGVVEHGELINEYAHP